MITYPDDTIALANDIIAIARSITQGYIPAALREMAITRLDCMLEKLATLLADPMAKIEEEDDGR